MLGGFYKEAAPFRLVGQVGLEPTMVKPADLQSVAIAARRLTLIFSMMQMYVTERKLCSHRPSW